MKDLTYYEKNRVSNIVWTITKAYGKNVDTSLLTEDYFDYDLLYGSAILGSLYSTLDYSMIEEFSTTLKKSINSYKEILYLFFVCIEETCINAEIEYIENIYNIREKNYKEKLLELNNVKQKDKLYNAIRLCYYSYILGLPLTFDRRVVELIMDVKKFRGIDNTIEFIKEFVNILNKFFKTEKELNTEKELQKPELEKFLENQTNKKQKVFEFFDTYTSSEFNPNESIIEINFSKDSHTINEKGSQRNEEKNFEKIANYYGEPLYNLATTKELEKRYVKGIHKGHKLFFTKAEPSTIHDKYRNEQVTEEVNKNITQYNKNVAVYENEIKKLKTILLQILNQDDMEIFTSSAGKLVARDVYKAKAFNNRHIFKKERKHEIQPPIVDIVLDASASLLDKQSDLSIQAYIVSKALQELGIKNSVTSFNNFLDYSIIKYLKTYEDKDCKRCFDYYCSGGNRDGLAIDVIGKMTKQKNEQNRIMIVFTDAKPYDVQVIFEIGQRMKTPYQGEMAVKDTADTLRRLRYENLKIIGIFSGDDKDMQVLRLIYGTDFIYIKNIERFSEEVGKILKDFLLIHN